MEQVLQALQSILARLDVIESKLGAPGASAEQQRQRDLYSDLFAAVPWNAAAEAYAQDKYPIALRHPDLSLVSAKAMSCRANDPLGFAGIHALPMADRIQWYGDMVREDGQQGMFATAEQAATWGRKVTSDVVVGPA